MNRSRRRWSRYAIEVKVLRILRPVGIAFFVLITLFPFYYMVLLSMREISEVIESPGSIVIGIGDLSSAAYERVLKPTSEGGEGFVRFLINSALLGLGTVFVTLVASILGVDPAVVPDRGSLAYDRIIEGIATGAIRGLWVVATNTAHSWIGQDDVRELLGRLDFLVVQDLYATTETAQLADLVLPAAGWGEKEGTFINSERRIATIRPVSRAPGQALTDLRIVRLLAEAWGCGELFAGWDSPEAIFHLLRQLSRGRPCDFSGISGYAELDAAGGIQWPKPRPGPVAQERRLFTDGAFHHPDGRARFVVDDPRPPAEHLRPSRPLVLLTGRGSSSEWHTGTRTSKSALLRSLTPDDPYVEIAPADAAARGIGPHAWVEVSSERATVRARAFVTPTIPAGQVFLSMHHEVTNQLTMPSFDPHSRQPAYKHAAVEVAPLRSRGAAS
jgi:predicted molibdopterin-dependent oxidoreductase YjgC